MQPLVHDFNISRKLEKTNFPTDFRSTPLYTNQCPYNIVNPFFFIFVSVGNKFTFELSNSANIISPCMLALSYSTYLSPVFHPFFIHKVSPFYCLLNSIQLMYSSLSLSLIQFELYRYSIESAVVQNVIIT